MEKKKKSKDSKKKEPLYVYPPEKWEKFSNLLQEIYEKEIENG